MKHVFAILAALALTAACASPTHDPYRPPLVPEPTEQYSAVAKTQCDNAGGSYQRAGMLGWYRCTMPYWDGGKVCTSSSQCEGQCMSDGHGSGAFGKGKGTCAMNDDPFGCYATVEDGVIQPTLCVD